MGGAHILMIGGADTEILHPSLFNIQYSLFRFVVTEGSDKSEFDGLREVGVEVLLMRGGRSKSGIALDFSYPQMLWIFRCFFGQFVV